MHARILLSLLLLMLADFALPSDALAQSCTATATNINFGTLAIGGVTGATATGTITEGCSAGFSTNGSLEICTAIGYGPSSLSQTNRLLGFSGFTLPYQLYQDAGYTTLYVYPGVTGTSSVTIPYTTASGASYNKPIYAKIIGSTSSLPPGTYTDTYSNTGQVDVAFDTFPPRNVCGISGHLNMAAPFTVSATLAASCVVTATNLVFPTSGVLITNSRDATSTLSVTCTSTTAYSIALSAGNGAGATTAVRKMTGPGGATVDYSLYRDNNRTLVWGTTAGSDTVAGTGNGSAQTISVYGRVKPQITPAPGLYADTVNVTVKY